MSLSADLERLERRHTTPWGEYLADGTGLAAWAADTVDAEAERDLGRLAEWASEVTERREP
jgi:hypothetical protein